jgi:outer membrane protein assembly factor BamB
VVSQTAKIAGDFNPEFTTVGVDANGNTGILAESVTPNTDLSVLLWTHSTTDPANTFKGPITVAAGSKPYTCHDVHNTVTIGNAAGVLTALDPKDGTKMWATEQWADDDTPCVWKTRIVEYQVAPAQ